MRSDVSNQVEASTPHILSQDKLKLFWITWYEGSIRLGSGTQMNDEPVLTLDVSDVTVNSLSLGSRHQDPAMWEFEKNMGENFEFIEFLK